MKREREYVIAIGLHFFSQKFNVQTVFLCKNTHTNENMRIFKAIMPCGAWFSHRPFANESVLVDEIWTLFSFFIPTLH